MQVALRPRLFWRQRLRWNKGGHLFVCAPESVFFKPQPHMSFYQKTLYWSYPVNDFIVMLFMPVLFALPCACLTFDTCPYGMDRMLFWTHILELCMDFVCAVYHEDYSSVKVSINERIGSRVLWFTSVKACINLLMVHTGWKDPGFFKYTPKTSETEQVEASGGSGALARPADIVSRPAKAAAKGGSSIDSNLDSLDASSGSAVAEAAPPCRRERPHLSWLHAALSRVTEARRCFMPLGGTLDIWVLLAVTAADLTAAAVGLSKLETSSLLRWDENNTIQLIGIVFAILDSIPGILFLGCARACCVPSVLRNIIATRTQLGFHAL